jgi:hypothetical protein
MSMGYEGLALLNVEGIDYAMALCTGANVPRVRPRMESSSAYGGKIRGVVPNIDPSEMGIGTPETYDWEQHDGSMDLELTESFYSDQIKPWIFDRQKGAAVTLQSRHDNDQSFLKCYWNSINISASDGGPVTSSISFVAMQRDAYTVGGQYINNKFPDPNSLCGAGPSTPPFVVPEPLNPSADVNLVPIPYWNTSLVLDGVDVEFITWTVDFSQEVVKFFGCEVNANPVEPRFVGVGPMTATFSGDYMFVGTAPFTIVDALPSLTINIGGDDLKFEDLELQSATDAVQGPTSVVPIAIEYAAYTLAV